MHRCRLPLLFSLLVFLCGFTVLAPTVQALTCIQFPLSTTGEEVCVEGALPAGPLEIGPGDAVSLPEVRFVNRTNRDMTFRIEANGSFITPNGNFVQLAPGAETTIEYLVYMKADDYVPIGSAEDITVAWSARGTRAGEPDYAFAQPILVPLLIGPDSDGDGLVDSWETLGYDPDADGDIDVDLPALGADPMHKDMFVEIDWEPGLKPTLRAVGTLEAVFARAPIDVGGVPNPDDEPGITVHVDMGGAGGSPEFAGAAGRGTEIPAGQWTFRTFCVGGPDDGLPCFPEFGCASDGDEDPPAFCDSAFNQAKRQYFDFFPRRFIFRYVIATAGGDTSGQAEVGGDDIWIGPDFDGQVLIHEIGHTLNLGHGGAPEEFRNCEPNYLSVMNYRYSLLTRINGSTHIDFSPPRIRGGDADRAQVMDDLDETELAEAVLDATDSDHVVTFVGPPAVCSALCDGGPRHGARCGSNDDCTPGVCRGASESGDPCTADSECGGGRCGGILETARANEAVDWNQNGTLGEVVEQNIDAYFQDIKSCGEERLAAELGVLTGYDDWANMRLRFRPSGSIGEAQQNVPEEREPTPAEVEANARAVVTADLQLEKTGPAGPVEAATATILGYDLAVRNDGPGLGGTIRVEDALPVGFAVTSMDDRCVAAGGMVTCEAVGLFRDQETSFHIEVEGTPTCTAGVPDALVNAATVENVSEFAGDDPDPSDNADSFETEVIDTTPPTLTVEVSPKTLWTPNHTLRQIEIALAAEDTCDEAPTIRLVSVTSNEADDGLGDGATTEDIQGADLGTADTHLWLRAERNGGGEGRVYTLTYEAADSSGNVTTVSETVEVAASNAP